MVSDSNHQDFIKSALWTRHFHLLSFLYVVYLVLLYIVSSNKSVDFNHLALKLMQCLFLLSNRLLHEHCRESIIEWA